MSTYHYEFTMNGDRVVATSSQDEETLRTTLILQVAGGSVTIDYDFDPSLPPGQAVSAALGTMLENLLPYISTVLRKQVQQKTEQEIRRLLGDAG